MIETPNLNNDSLFLDKSLIEKNKLRALCQRAILSCVRNGVFGWWNCKGTHECNSVAVLRNFLKDYVSKGNHQDFIDISRKLDNLVGEEIKNEDFSLKKTIKIKLTKIYKKYVSCDPESVVSGMLSLREAEMHPTAKGELSLLRDTAKKIWLHGKRLIDSETNKEQVKEISRMLMHYDLVDAATECLRLGLIESDLLDFITEWQDSVKENQKWSASILKGLAKDTDICVVGETIWGEDYINFFLKYHIPCLLAEGNVPHLKKRGKTILSIVTNESGKEQIKVHKSFVEISNYAEVHFTIFSQIPSRNTQEQAAEFYRRYGLLDHHHVYIARSLNSDLILMPPDNVISSSSFFTLIKNIEEGYDCCSVACIEVDKELVLPHIDKKIGSENQLDIDGESLLNLAASHKRDYFRSLIFSKGNRAGAYPREFFWKVPGGYMCHSVFMHPVALSARVLSREFHPNHENVDWALIPRILKEDGKMKIIEDASQFAIMHCSNEEVRANEYTDHQYELKPALYNFLNVHGQDYPIHRECFKMGQFFPCNDNEFPVSQSYEKELASVLDMFAAVGDHEKNV